MSDAFATRTEVNGLGARVAIVERTQSAQGADIVNICRTLDEVKRDKKECETEKNDEFRRVREEFKDEIRILSSVFSEATKAMNKAINSATLKLGIAVGALQVVMLIIARFLAAFQQGSP